MATESILGYNITTETKEECVGRIVSWIEQGERARFLACANPHSLMVANEDAAFEKALNGADLLIPDGMGMVMASSLLGGSIRARITGSDIFMGVSAELNRRRDFSYFFLGSTEENLRALRDRMKADFLNIEIAGTYAPPFEERFSDAQNREMISAVNRAKPDVLWVGLTAPKQEKWIYEHRHVLDVKFVAAVGAVLDFYTGKVQRSHPAFQKAGLEWLPRLMREPGRLWKRTFISAPKFMYQVMRKGR
jgi:N-acetylglucosaminyldiphosphoundecaprenol N-acetyl-beta-D-mannosaminyltransferase